MIVLRKIPTRRLPPCIRLASASAAAALILGGCGKAPPPPPPPPIVTVTTVGQEDVPVTQEWVATLHGFVDAQIRAQVTGYLMRQDYREGDVVKKGTLLFEIDPRPFKAALDQAQAQLAQAQAQYGKTEQDVKRYGPLAKQEAISAQELDDAVQANLGARAQIQAAKAAVETARLNLAFTRITSPVDGVAGLIQAQVGDLVGPGTGLLTTVSQLDPMRVYFPISEQTYLDFRRQDPAGQGFPAQLPLTLILADGSEYPHPGRFFASDLQIDPDTGTIEIAALFPNPGNLLRPGQYGRVRAVVRTLKGALVVPTRAISQLQGGYELFLLDSGNRARVVSVVPGPERGAMTVVTGAVKAGDRVIVDGFQKARDGTLVSPQPYRP